VAHCGYELPVHDVPALVWAAVLARSLRAVARVHLRGEPALLVAPPLVRRLPAPPQDPHPAQRVAPSSVA